jgi:hypothetical protein
MERHRVQHLGTGGIDCGPIIGFPGLPGQYDYGQRA